MAGAPPPVHSPEPIQVPKRKNAVLLWMLVVAILGGGICLMGLMAAVLLPVFSQASQSAQQETCMSHLKRLGSAIAMYSLDHDDRMPTGEWMDALLKYEDDPVTYACPVQRRRDTKSYGYALSISVAGKQTSVIPTPAQTPLVFDSIEVGRNAIAPTTATPRPGRHKNGRSNMVAYVDGSVRAVARD
ncbi:MAG TPA: hypothetical protein VEX38_08535 [Fimbriimonadaceae bacterium]|nr:hypothetical protein [Fimbriimonadaceae bacterium]